MSCPTTPPCNKLRYNTMKLAVCLGLIAAFAINSFAQLSFKNQFESTYWDEYKRNITENWTDLTYQRQWLQLGARYEINRPPDPNIFPQDSLLKQYELTYLYAQFQYKQLSATLGNYYAMFGRGLVLRTYEDRNLRLDNNLEGAKINFSGSLFKVQALAGRMRDKYNRRKEWLYGLDAQATLFEGIHLGGSYLYQENSALNREQFWAARFNISRDWWDIYAEVARPDWKNSFSFYGAANLALSKFTLTAELKDYNKLSFPNKYGSEYNAAPSLSREHFFTLLNKHPHALDMNDEKGYQLEATYSHSDEFQLLLNHSQTFNHADKRIFNEYYGEVHHSLQDLLEYRLAAAWNYDFTTNTENITLLIDGSYNLSECDQLHGSYQHQHTKNRFDKSEYDNELLLLEYSRAPWLSLALVGEYTNKDQLRNVQMDRNYWIYGAVTFNFFKNQQLSILYGSRQEGFICVGGVCRYEPEFRGIEIKLTNRF